MKNLFREAHKLTKEIVAKYGVHYPTQFAICARYLANKGAEEVNMLAELQGTEKQVKWATYIREIALTQVDALIEVSNNEHLKTVRRLLASETSAVFFIEVETRDHCFLETDMLRQLFKRHNETYKKTERKSIQQVMKDVCLQQTQKFADSLLKVKALTKEETRKMIAEHGLAIKFGKQNCQFKYVEDFGVCCGDIQQGLQCKFNKEKDTVIASRAYDRYN